MEKVPITREGLESLKEELTRLIKVERPDNIKSIETARAHGDLSENAEYHAAKERQGLLQARISDIQTQIGNSDVIPIEDNYETAVFGAKIILENIKTGERIKYQLVGPFESAPEEGKISVTAPLGQALVGKEEGDEVKVQTPGGLQEMEIVEIL